MKPGPIIVLMAIRMGMIPREREAQLIGLLADVGDFPSCVQRLQDDGHISPAQANLLAPKVTLLEKAHHRTEFLRGLGIIASDRADDLNSKYLERLAQSNETIEEILKEEGIEISENTQTFKAAERAAASSAIKADTQFGRYYLVQELGRGGAGVVFKAIDQTLNREVALKVLRPGQDDEGIVRFIQEAQSVAKLKHPAILGLHDFGIHENRYFFTMDFIDGAPLSELILKNELPQRTAVEIMREICRGVAFAHGQGVLHRDIKPENILVDKLNHGYIVDFGLARELREGEAQKKGGLTHAGTIFGTPEFMPPEQARGDSELVDHRSDVYSLGATLYFILAKKPPFVGTNWRHVLDLVLSLDPERPSKFTKLDRDLETICLHAMEKDPARRYRSAGDLADDLDRYLKSEPIQARRSSWFYQFWKNKKNRIAVYIAAPCVLASAAVGYVVVDQAAREVNYRNIVGQGDTAMEKGDLPAALDAYDRALALRPEDASVRPKRDNAMKLKEEKERVEREAKVREMIARAAEFLKQEEFDGAIKLYDDALALEPANVDAKAGRERALKRKGAKAAMAEASKFLKIVETSGITDWNSYKSDIDEAIKASLQAAKIDAETGNSAFIRGRGFHLLGDYRNASIAYGEALKVEPNHQNALLGRIQLGTVRAFLAFSRIDRTEWNTREVAVHQALAKGDLQALDATGAALLTLEQKAALPGHRMLAEGKYEEALAWSQKAGDQTIHAMASAYLGNLDGAATALTSALSKAPKDFLLLLLRGNMRFGVSVDDAMADYIQCSQVNPTFAEGHFARGLGWLSQNRLPQAENDLRQCLMLESDFAPALFGRARAVLGQGRHDDALKDIDAYLALRVDAAAVRLRAVILRSQSDWTGAIQEWNKYLALKPSDAQALVERAACWRELKKSAESMADLEAAIKLDPKIPEAYWQRGLLLEATGKWDEAVHDYSQVIKLDPARAEAYMRKAAIHEERKQWSEAVSTYTDLLNRDASNVDALTARGFLYRKRGEPGPALEDFDKAISVDPKRPRPHVGRGLILFDKKDLDGALTSFDRAVTADPGLKEGYYHRGVARMLKSQFDLALADLDRAGTEGFPSAPYLRMVALNGLGRHDEALKQFDKAPGNDPEVHLQKAIALEGMNDLKGAIGALNKVLELDPLHVEALYKRGCDYQLMDETVNAIADFSTIIRRDAKHAGAHVRRGLALLAQGDSDKAMNDIERALALAPGRADAVLARAGLYQSRGEYAKAIQDYDSLLRADARSIEALVGRGLAKHQSQNYLGALKDYAEALRVNPKNLPALINRGITQISMRELDGAIATLTEASKIDPGNFAVLMNRGGALLQKGDAKSAAADFSLVILMKHGYAEAYLNRGLARTSLGDMKDAEDDFKQAIKLKPGYAQAHLNLAALYMMQNQDDAALEEIDKSIQADPANADAYVNRAQLRLKKGEAERADADVQLALQIDPKSAPAYIIRGLVLETLGQKAEALKAYDKAIELAPFDGVARYNRGVFLFKNGNFAQANQDFQTAIKLSPDQKAAIQPYLDESASQLKNGHEK